MNSKDYTVSGLNCQLVQARVKKTESVVQCLKKYSPLNIESWWSLKIVGGGGVEEGKDKLKSQKSINTSTKNVQGIFDRGIIKMAISSTHQIKRICMRRIWNSYIIISKQFGGIK